MAYKGDGGANRGAGRQDSVGGGGASGAGRDGSGGGRDPRSDPSSPEYNGGSTVGGMGTNTTGHAAKKTSTTNGQIDGPPTPGGGVPGGARADLSIDNGRKVGAAYRDYVGHGDSMLDSLGNMLARAFGFQEANPTDPTAPNATGVNAPNVTGNASWSVDPIALALGIGGLANPIINLAGWAYNGLKQVSGWTGAEIAMDSGGSRPSSAQPGLRSGERPGSDVVGLDNGGSRGTFAAAPRGTTAATADASAPPSSTPVTEELLTGVTGRNRNGRLLTPDAAVAAPVL